MPQWSGVRSRLPPSSAALRLLSVPFGSFRFGLFVVLDNHKTSHHIWILEVGSVDPVIILLLATARRVVLLLGLSWGVASLQIWMSACVRSSLNWAAGTRRGSFVVPGSWTDMQCGGTQTRRQQERRGTPEGWCHFQLPCLASDLLLSPYAILWSPRCALLRFPFLLHHFP